MADAPVIVNEGSTPLILAFPHAGTAVPADIQHNLNDEGALLRDTDWHIDALYADLIPEATTVTATFSRYVIDANRDPSGVSLYPEQTTTELIPATTFDNAPIWKQTDPFSQEETSRRLVLFHKPYHQALQTQIERIHQLHGFVLLYDCHSIRSIVPWLFDGTLPDLNIGTDGGKTCAPEIEQAAVRCAERSGRPYVLNGRFRGGWTTRHYGRPNQGIHAIQMELAQSSYLASEDIPFAYSPERAARLRPQLQALLTEILDAARHL